MKTLVENIQTRLDEEAKQKTILELAKIIRKKYPNVKIKYTDYEVIVCLGFDWAEKKENLKIEKFVNGLKDRRASVAADISGGGIKTY